MIANKTVPILVRLVGYDFDDEYIRVTEYTTINAPIPHIEISVELNLERITEDIGRLTKAQMPGAERHGAHPDHRDTRIMKMVFFKYRV